MPHKFDLAKCRASIRERMARIEHRLQKLQINWSDLETLPQQVNSKPLIFLGPSLNLELAQKNIHADFRSPIARGDLIQALEEGYRIFGIIDGVFHQNLTVGIEEIRYALEAGAAIYGASSMGALRAAETYPLGMIGVGKIYQWYRDETVDSDDEVALCFDERTGMALSEPSVNLRATLQFLKDAQKISVEDENIILETYLEFHFSRRNLRNLGESLLRKYPSGHEWISLITKFWIDQKAVDATTLLNTIREKHVIDPVR